MSSPAAPRERHSVSGGAILGALIVAVGLISLALLVAISKSDSVGGGEISGRAGSGGGSSDGNGVRKLATAPAFSAEELNALPTEQWITNGGTLANQRYSPLDEITTSNVSGLKGVWLTHLKGSGTAAKYSAEAQPIVYNGVLYV